MPSSLFGPLKLLFDWQGRLELYDIPADPFEEHDLAEEQSELAEKLFLQLKSWLHENVEP